MRRLRVAMAQINTIVGDYSGNTKKIISSVEKAKGLGADIITFPELAVTGCPPEDLLLKPSFIKDNKEALGKIVQATKGITAIVGFVDGDKELFNAAAVIYNGEIKDVHRKTKLADKGIYNESRYFKAGLEQKTYLISGVHVGINIFEDVWRGIEEEMPVQYGPIDILVGISASPFYYGKREEREKALCSKAVKERVTIAYNNLVGGQDELVYDGNSVICDYQGNMLARGKHFEEDIVLTDIEFAYDKPIAISKGVYEEPLFICKASDWEAKPPLKTREFNPAPSLEEAYRALVVGTRDYMAKNGFEKVVVGLSGGIDSSIVATIAVDALGASNVIGVLMPSRYTSNASIDDAELLAKNLGMKVLNIPIENTFKTLLEELEPVFKGNEVDSTEENMQARIRGNILMALSNKFGWLVLATGNKSEMATGFTTLYGDLAGGFAVIKDVPKTLVYKLVDYRNNVTKKELIPQQIIKKEPSAELRHNQKDSDSLPPYEVIDPIVEAYVEEEKSIEQILESGFEAEAVQRVIKLVDKSEYKRRQAPPGIRITPKAFDRGRRLPITNAYRR